MNDDENVVVFCNTLDALDILSEAYKDRLYEFINNMVISTAIPRGEATIVPKAEFLEWLKGKKE